MKERKIFWAIPKDWKHRELKDIAAKIIDTHKEALIVLRKALKEGDLKAVRGVH
jgi:hypothetical protein